MRQVRWLAGVALGAALASSWWGAAIFGYFPEGHNLQGTITPLWLIPGFLTFGCVFGCVLYLVINGAKE